MKKKHFILFVELLLLCSDCRKHYQQNQMLCCYNSLIKFSLTDIFLILHTHIQEIKDNNSDQIVLQFIPEKRKIKCEFKTKFLDFFKLL